MLVEVRIEVLMVLVIVMILCAGDVTPAEKVGLIVDPVELWVLFPASRKKAVIPTMIITSTIATPMYFDNPPRKICRFKSEHQFVLVDDILIDREVVRLPAARQPKK